jgi:hypothetical protein
MDLAQHLFGIREPEEDLIHGRGGEMPIRPGQVSGFALLHLKATGFNGTSIAPSRYLDHVRAMIESCRASGAFERSGQEVPAAAANVEQIVGRTQL